MPRTPANIAALCVACGLLLLTLLLLVPGLNAGAVDEPAAAAADGMAYEIPIEGPIGPAMGSFVSNELANAEAMGAEVVILRLDTPGGLMRATRVIVQAILASPVPVIGYVAPQGARAASAGAYIMYATHIAAMAPATHLGAATPVTMGGSPLSPSPEDNQDSDDADEQETQGASNEQAMRNKLVNDAAAFMRSLALQRGRNADWVDQAVREGASLTASEALELNVINLMADSRADLLNQVDGTTVTTEAGSITLHTSGIQVEQTEPDWRNQLLSIITQPTIAYLLLMIGIVGLLIEGLNPGVVLPGVLGGISLLVALYAFQLLPINYAGLALIVLGVCLMVAELFVPSFGALGLGGIGAFVFGSIMLMDNDVPGFQLSYALFIGLAIGCALAILLIIFFFVRSRRKQVHTGSQGLVGSECLAMHDFDAAGAGRVWLHGESWLARCDQPVHKNDVLEVIAAEGLTVTVRPLAQQLRSPSQTGSA